VIPDRYSFASGLQISRLVTGLWQVADMERDGRALDIDKAAADLELYARAGYDTFDMADHYGSAEIIAGRCQQRLAGAGLKPAVILTKWVPEPGPMTAEVVRVALTERLSRLAASRVDLLQLHWWQFENPGYLDAMTELDGLRRQGLIGHLGVTNFDTDHLRVLLAEGLPVVTNQVCFSLLDRRAAGLMSEFCLANGVRLLAFGTLAGGFLSERWLGQREPAPDAIADWSKMKYKRFIDAAGGWQPFQKLLAALQSIATRHQVTIANVATRWVLDHPAVAAAIIGARLGESEHRQANLATFGFALDGEDKKRLDEALAGLTPIPGDCGDEYRRPPFLTASGDLSHHLANLPPVFAATPVPGRPQRLRVDSGSQWEPIAGYSRAIRVGNRVLVSGTTATHGPGRVVAKGDPAAQTVYILDKISASLRAAGAELADVVQTRIYLKDSANWEPVSRVHGRYFADVRPANTLLAAGGLVGDYEVEIEAEAIVGPG
jgi:aryl-alcohol dehydrogenase-like predicted oxidoreductase/enamine deaminase RidA (YjgF/YER057c/UK114 family)